MKRGWLCAVQTLSERPHADRHPSPGLLRPQTSSGGSRLSASPPPASRRAGPGCGAPGRASSPCSRVRRTPARGAPTRPAGPPPDPGPRAPPLTSAGWPGGRCAQHLQLVPPCHLRLLHRAAVRGPTLPLYVPGGSDIAVPPCAAGAVPTTPDASGRRWARLTRGRSAARGRGGGSSGATPGAPLAGRRGGVGSSEPPGDAVCPGVPLEASEALLSRAGRASGRQEPPPVASSRLPPPAA